MTRECHWYSSINCLSQIIHREAQLYLPETETFVRLMIMSILGTISVIITLLLLCFAAKGKVFQWNVSRTVSAFFSCFYHFYFREGLMITGKITQIFNCNWTKITFPFRCWNGQAGSEGTTSLTRAVGRTENGQVWMESIIWQYCSPWTAAPWSKLVLPQYSQPENGGQGGNWNVGSSQQVNFLYGDILIV